MGRLEARASRVVESHSPAQVWAFIRPAESAVLLDPDTVRGFTVPGTGSGVGEQQCFFTLVDGREVPHVLTITAVEPEVFAEAVSSSGGIPSGSRYELEPVDNGTRIVLRSWLDVPDGAAVDGDATLKAMSIQADRYVARVKALLEGPPLDDLFSRRT